jgi:hypothetical protein
MRARPSRVDAPPDNPRALREGVDRRRRIRNVYGLDFLDPRLLLADVRTLLLEDRTVRR